MTLTTILTFLRQPDGDVAILRVAHVAPAAPEALVTAIGDALGRWITTTDEGRAAWAHSCEDFNIGDLASYGLAEELRAELTKEGLEILEVETLATSAVFPFDRVLPNLPDSENAA